MLEDEKIIQGCKDNDRRYQQELFVKYGQKMYGFCLRYSSSSDDANDLLQDGFIKVFENIKSYSGESPLPAWMSRIFINLAISRFRANARKPQLLDIDDADIPDTNDDVHVEMHDVKKVMAAMLELPDKYRLVLNMYAIDKMSHKEIAEQLGISEGTSKSQLSRARQMLKDTLERKKQTESK